MTLMSESSRKSNRRWLLAGFLVFVLLLAAFLTWWMLRSRKPMVTLTTVRRHTLQDVVLGAGTVRPDDRDVIYSNELTAPVESIPVHVGEEVSKGTVLIQEKNATEEAAVSSAETSVDDARSTYNDALQTYNNAPVLARAQYQSQVESAKSALDQSEAQLRQAEAALANLQILATQNGTVITVQPDGLNSDGTAGPIVEVVGKTKHIELDVSEVDAVHLKPKMKAQITSDAYPNQTFSGTVSQVASYATEASSGSGQVEVDVMSSPNFPVPLGYQVDVQITSSTRPNTIAVPYEALVQNGDQYSVFVYSNGHVQETPVTLGITTDQYVEVIKGLSTGTSLVTNPPSDLQSGEAVRIQ